MSIKKQYDAVVVGSGPNGLAAAITLAQVGKSVLLLERSSNPGGGAQTSELTLPGFHHDICSAIHPMAIASPFFQSLPLDQYGLEWIHSPAPLAHPLDSERVILLERSVQQTAQQFGVDEKRYQKLFTPWVESSSEIFEMIFAPLTRVPKKPILAARFGISALLSADQFAKLNFRSMEAKALFAGIAGHASIPLTWPGSSAIGLALSIAGHSGGWPLPKGGAQQITNALLSYFRSLGGDFQLGFEVRTLKDLPSTKAVFLNLTPKQILKIAGDQLSPRYQRSLRRFQYGPGVFKMDWALSGPIPWKNPKCLQAATVHLGGSLEEIIDSEKTDHTKKHSQHPFVLLSQPTLFDPTRAPPNQHTAWAYCHVPQGSTENLQALIENQVERFAPGFKDKIIARHRMTTADFEAHNPNLVGGDINGGLNRLDQMIFRPTLRLSPYQTSSKKIFICSSSTPPGSGVHGMCGNQAARTYLRRKNVDI